MTEPFYMTDGRDMKPEGGAAAMAACEKCWNDAYLRWMADPGKPQADHYADLIKERKDNPCTPEQQAEGR